MSTATHARPCLLPAPLRRRVPNAASDELDELQVELLGSKSEAMTFPPAVSKQVRRGSLMSLVAAAQASPLRVPIHLGGASGASIASSISSTISRACPPPLRGALRPHR